MLFTSIGPDAPFYRALTPRWAFQPESGAGAARQGGRFNRVGIEARYLAESPELALIEYQGEDSLLQPATVAAYRVTSPRVVDFSRGYVADVWSSIWDEAYCEWKALAMLDDIEPPSWVIGDLVRQAGAAGILYRSAQPAARGGICLVLFPELHHLYRAPVNDPNGLLPRSPASWST